MTLKEKELHKCAWEIAYGGFKHLEEGDEFCLGCEIDYFWQYDSGYHLNISVDHENKLGEVRELVKKYTAIIRADKDYEPHWYKEYCEHLEQTLHEYLVQQYPENYIENAVREVVDGKVIYRRRNENKR